MDALQFFRQFGFEAVEPPAPLPYDLDVSIFVSSLRAIIDSLKMRASTKVLLPVNEAIDALLESVNEERKLERRKALTLDELRRSTVWYEIVRNHVQLLNTGLDAFAFVGKNYICFALDEINGVETVDGISISQTIGQYQKLDGILVTNLQMDELVDDIKQRRIRVISEEEAVTMIDATDINIGTDMKVLMDLLYNHSKPQWRDMAEVEFQFYNSLRGFVGETLKLRVNALYRQRAIDKYFENPLMFKENLGEVLRMAEELTDKLMRNLEKYKICYNENEWIDIFEPIADLPFDQYIRLSNGACWDIVNLITHFKENKGFNRAPNVKGYPTETLFNRWSPDVDREHLFNHPVAKEDRLREWYAKRTEDLREYSKIISEETMRTLKSLLEIMTSKGPAFVKALREELPPKALEALRKAKGVISETEEYKEEILTIIEKVLKSQASYRLVEYLRKLPKQEFDAINDFEPSLMQILTQCSEGQACVWYTADIVRNTYNDIAEIKGIPKIFPDIKKFNHVAPIAIEY